MSRDTTDGSVILTYSGEVYNFLELRAELQKRGHRFRTNSDTEVVLSGYLEWGEELPKYLNGMFAFAIWDGRYSKLILVRDRMGIKPLFYYPTGDGLIFGSESKAILTNPVVEKVIDLEGIRQFFTRFNINADRALWKNIYEVNPGSILSVSPSGMRTSKYWRLEAKQHTHNRGETIYTVRELLNDTVKRQLMADVPQSVLLSGGLDSSSIAAFAADHLRNQGRTLSTFSVSFVDSDQHFTPSAGWPGRDAPFVRDMVAHIESAHREIDIGHEDLSDPQVRRMALAARDTPGMGELDRSLYMLCKQVSQNSTVALSGEAADEIFGGYHWFHDSSIRSSLTRVKQKQNSDTEGLSDSWFHPDSHRKLQLVDYASERHAAAIRAVEHLDDETEIDRQVRTISHLLLHRPLLRLLERKDRISMALGLEVRVPYCDHRIVEYVYNIPWEIKNFDYKEKSILRGVGKELLPDSILNRTKSMFPTNQNPNYKASLLKQFREAANDSDNPVFYLIDENWAQRLSQLPDSAFNNASIGRVDMFLDLYHWFDMYTPKIEMY